MNRKVVVPGWFLAVSTLLNVFLAGALLIVFLVPSLTPTKLVRIVEVRVTATPLPATATLVPSPTPTVTPTATALPPTATPVPCKQGEVAGVDCPVDVGGLAVTVASVERVEVVYDATNQEVKPDDGNVWLVVTLVLPSWTTEGDLAPWFEDGGTHLPVVVDGEGNVDELRGLWPEAAAGGGLGIGMIFEVPKEAESLTIVIQPGDEVDLSLVPDITANSPTPNK